MHAVYRLYVDGALLYALIFSVPAGILRRIPVHNASSLMCKLRKLFTMTLLIIKHGEINYALHSNNMENLENKGSQRVSLFLNMCVTVVIIILVGDFPIISSPIRVDVSVHNMSVNPSLCACVYLYLCVCLIKAKAFEPNVCMQHDPH